MLHGRKKRINLSYLSSFSRSQRTIPPRPLSLRPSWLRWGLILRPRLCPLWPLRQWFRDHMAHRSPTQACSSSSSSTPHPWTLQCPRPVWRVHLERLLEMSYRYSPHIHCLKTNFCNWQTPPEIIQRESFQPETWNLPFLPLSLCSPSQLRRSWRSPSPMSTWSWRQHLRGSFRSAWLWLLTLWVHFYFLCTEWSELAEWSL